MSQSRIRVPNDHTLANMSIEQRNDLLDAYEGELERLINDEMLRVYDR